MQIITIPPSASGISLTIYLANQGISLSAPCGGRGVCQKCRVQVTDGQFLSRVSGKVLSPDDDGYILACQAICPSEGASIALPETTGSGLTAMPALEAGGNGTADHRIDAIPDGIALDLGTTTLAAARVDRETGKILSTVSCLNPQQSFGADVISRIDACRSGQLTAMQSCLLDAVRRLIGQLFPDTETALCDLTAAGNTTMLHLFCGISPESMGTYPFTPVFTDAKTMSGTDLDLPVRTVTVLPSVSAFIGGDITAGMFFCGFGSSPVPLLLLDIGTNGEMVLDTGAVLGNRLIAASTAAGPALEGANISCGLGGVAGAVSRVRMEKNTLVYQTIGDAPARGICGCGLIDLCACLLSRTIVDETGYLENDPYVLTGSHQTAHGSFPENATSVCLTQKDIRELQLAKSALRAGLEALLHSAGMQVRSFTEKGGKVCIAGGLGYYLDPVNAAGIGLLPPEFLAAPDTVTAVGNTSLAGAVQVLTDPSALDRMSVLAKQCTCIELNRSQVFNDGFIEHMLFPCEI